MPVQRMTTIRRRYIADEWHYQVVPDDAGADDPVPPFVPGTKLPAEIYALIALCLLGVQDGLEVISAEEWKVPSRELDSWMQASAAAERDKFCMRDGFRFETGSAPLAPAATSTVQEVRLQTCDDPERDSEAWAGRGYEVIGGVDAVLGGNGEPPERQATAQAKAVGATLVLYNLWAAKRRAIKRRADGTIDLAALLADPPARPRPDGTYVVKAVFLRPRAG